MLGFWVPGLDELRTVYMLGSGAEHGPWKDIDTKNHREGLGEQPSL